MAKDIIIRLQPSDIISDSMDKINYNFDVLLNKNEVDEYKYLDYFKRLNDRLDEIQRSSDSRDADLANGITNLNDKLEGMQSDQDIQDLINDALANVNNDLQNFVTRTEFERGLTQKLGDYVRSADLRTTIEGYHYITSAAFDEFIADASNGTAQAQRLVANAEFYKELNETLGKECFVYLDGRISGFSTIEEYYDSVKNEVDPDNYGLIDDDVVTRLIKKAESVFRVIYKEVSLIKQKVVDGEATLDIMAAIQDPESGEDIVAAIFMKADSMGSNIALTADHIKLTSDKTLTLSTGLFSIESDQFSIDLDGNVVANDMTANNLYVNGINLRTGHTLIGDDGILHADGAVISGDIIADRFIATETKEMSISGNMSGPVTKTTTINASTFNIDANGTLYYGSEQREINNSLYIKIVDEMDNEHTDIIPSATLVGVPVLCMMYEGEEYMLSPGSWISSSRGADSTNMRWIKQFDVMHYAFNKPTSNNAYSYSWSEKCVTGNISNVLNTPGTYYMFNPDYRESLGGSWGYGTGILKFGTNGNSSMVNSKDEMFIFKVLNWGNESTISNKINMIRNAKLSTGTTKDNVNTYAAYALESKIDDVNEGTGSGTFTPIDQGNCNKYEGFLSESMTFGVAYESHYSTENPVNYNGLDETTLKDGSNRTWAKCIYEYMQNVVNGGPESNHVWTEDSNMATNYVVSGLNRNNLPMDPNPTDPNSSVDGYKPHNKTEKFFGVDLHYYPIITIGNYGKELSTTTKQVWVTISAVASATYEWNINNHSIQIRPWTESGLTSDLLLTDMTLELSFDFFLDMSTGFTGFIPMENANYNGQTYIENYIKSFLENVDLTTLTNSTYAKFKGTIRGSQNLIKKSFNTYDY